MPRSSFRSNNHQRNIKIFFVSSIQVKTQSPSKIKRIPKFLPLENPPKRIKTNPKTNKQPNQTKTPPIININNKIPQHKPTNINIHHKTNDHFLKCKTPKTQPQHNKKQSYSKPIISSKQLIESITSNNVIPSTIPVADDIGKLGLMWPRGLAKSHEAAPLLNNFSDEGCPVDCGTNWTNEHIMAALIRGPHISAKSKEAKQCLFRETESKVKEGFAKTIRWGDIKNNIPPNLKISPIAMIPHKSRKFRAILDLSFQLRVKGKHLPSVNSGTNKQAPQKAMAGLGNALKRIIHEMGEHYNPAFPFKFAKCDIKDGFWRMVVHPDDAYNFCYVLPSKSKNTPIDDIILVLPDSLQMGWCESPPFFCAATETARDVINFLITNQSTTTLPPHPMEDKMMELTSNKIQQIPPKISNITEVYVDDFCCGTNNLHPTHLRQTSRAILHGIHSIFPPTSITQHTGGDPISEKKMDQQDGTWMYEKEILGWLINGKEYTIYLPPDKSKKIIKLVKNTAKKSHVTLNEFQKMAGKLNHAVLGIPAGKGLFSPIYHAMRGDPNQINITKQLRQTLLDWCTLVQRLSTRPTMILELIPGIPWYVCYVDASGSGVGGVWLSGSKQLKPYVWRMQWPEDITKRLVSFKNPNGDINNSELEMAGVLLAWLVLEQIAPMSLQYSTVGIFCDNTPAVAWSNRLQSSKSTVAGHLLRVLALRQHVHRSSPCLTISIAGVINLMADHASRSYIKPQYLNPNKTFLDVFSTTFPLQSDSWTEYHLPNNLFSRVTSCLRGKPSTMASWLAIPKQDKNIGLTGKPMPVPTTTTLTSNLATTINPSSSSQPLLRGCGLASTATDVLSQFKPLETRYLPSPRPLNWLDFQAQSSKHKALTKSQWDGLWRDSNAKTPHQFPSSLYQLKYHNSADELVQPQNAPGDMP